VTVDSPRPRSRGDEHAIALRARLLAELGVDDAALQAASRNAA
jgi:sulfonate transport system ATP-binding protein